MNAPILALFFRQLVCEAVGIQESEFDSLIAAASWRVTASIAQIASCPYCNGCGQLISDGVRFAVRCGSCKSRTAPVASESQAIVQWNTRT